MKTTESWIDSFVDFGKTQHAPKNFLKWAAISVLSAAMQRKVYLRFVNRDLYPNFYIILCSDPGVGKSTAISIGKNIINDSDVFKKLPESITPEKLFLRMKQNGLDNKWKDHLNEAFSPGYFINDELSVLVTAENARMMNSLTNLYDCGETFEHDTIGRGSDVILKPYLTMLAGITPLWLEQAFLYKNIEAGFLARMNIVFPCSRPKIASEGFFNGTAEEDKSKKTTLRHDLKTIVGLKGKFDITKDAQRTFSLWHESGMLPVPNNIFLASYNTRRMIHVMKLSMIFAVAENKKLLITERNVKHAIDFLLENERILETNLIHFNQSPQALALENVIHDLRKQYDIQLKQTPNLPPIIREDALRKVVLKYFNLASIDLVVSELEIGKKILLHNNGKEFHPITNPKKKTGYNTYRITTV